MSYKIFRETILDDLKYKVYARLQLEKQIIASNIFEENLSEDFIFESEKFDVLFEDLLNEYNQDEAQKSV